MTGASDQGASFGLIRGFPVKVRESVFGGSGASAGALAGWATLPAGNSIHRSAQRAKRAKRAVQGSAFLGQLILDADRRLRNDASLHQSLGLEDPKAIGQHPVADVRDRRTDRGVAGWSAEECLNDGARPAASDKLDGFMKTTADGGDWLFHGLNLWNSRD